MKQPIVVILFLLCFARPGFAHKPSDSYLTLVVQDQKIEGQIDIALRDLEVAIGLDTNQDGAITWGELRSRHAAIAAYVLSRLEIKEEIRPVRVSALSSYSRLTFY